MKKENRTELTKQEFDNKMYEVAKIISETYATSYTPTPHDTLTGNFLLCDGQNPNLELYLLTYINYPDKTTVGARFPRFKNGDIVHLSGDSHTISFSNLKSAKAIAIDILKRGYEKFNAENLAAHERLAVWDAYYDKSENTKKELIKLGFEASNNGSDVMWCPPFLSADIHNVQVQGDKVKINLRGSLSIEKVKQLLNILN